MEHGVPQARAVYMAMGLVRIISITSLIERHIYIKLHIGFFHFGNRGSDGFRFVKGKSLY